MKTLVAKEIRLLLPAYGAALCLAILPVWLTPTSTQDGAENYALLPFWLGVALLALSAFGREFGLQTFSLLLAQPLDRRCIWWTKVTVLSVALASLLAALSFSCIACVYFAQPPLVWPKVLALAVVGVVVAFAGGLWTTLLLRQLAAAFWFTILIPWFVVLGVWLGEGSLWQVYAALGLYSVAGIWGAWRLFHRAQDSAWTGGVISLPTWTRSTGVSPRVRRPIVALCLKELKMHQVWLMGMACLFLAHLGVVALRNAHLQDFGGATRIIFLEVVGGIWLVVPLLASSLSIADERKLGTWQSHLCLPVPSRVQFLIKLLFVVLIPGLLSTALCCTAESFSKASTSHPEFWDLLPFFLGLSLVGFYASSIARNTMQALATAVAAALGATFLWALLANPRNFSVLGVVLWQGYLVHCISWPTLTITLLWLAYRNYRSVSETERLWRRNLFGLTAAGAVIFSATPLIYHRTWELLIPLEPQRGPARVTTSKPVAISSYGGVLATVMPDGRLWTDRIIDMPSLWFPATNDAPVFATGRQWYRLDGSSSMSGSNWVEVAVMSQSETVAIQSDGSLWLLENPRQPFDPVKRTPAVKHSINSFKIGDATNWQSVARESVWSVILLQRDGTLWRWGSWGTNWYNTYSRWPGLRAFQPQRLGTESNWARIDQGRFGLCAWKTDGQAWVFHRHNKKSKVQRQELVRGTFIDRFPSFDNIYWRSMANLYQVGIQEDGSLWTWQSIPLVNGGSYGEYQIKFKRIGNETNWVAVADGFKTLTALKADGSIWAWDANHGLELNPKPPTRLSTHSDWVAIGAAWGVVALATDGTLWRWFGSDGPILFTQPMLAESRKPTLIKHYFAERQ